MGKPMGKLMLKYEGLQHMKNVCLSEVLWRLKLRLNTVRHVTSIGPSITPVSTANETVNGEGRW